MVIETGLIISFATWLGSKIADKGFDSIYSKLTADSSFDKIFNECIQKTANKFEEKYPDLLGNSVDYFFTQEDVFDELCKLLFFDQKLNIEMISNTFHEASLPKNFVLEFIKELKEQLSTVPEFQSLLANKELYIAVKGISKNIQELSENSNLALEEIKSIKDILQTRFKHKFNTDSFLALYSKNLVNNLGTLNFIGLGIDPSIKKGKRKELEKIFVKPLFEMSSKYHRALEEKNNINYKSISDQYGESELIEYKHLFDRPYNFVILGNPGAGKSLLIKSIVCHIANKETESFSNKRISSYIPFRIELKNYLAYKKNHGGSILKYLTYSLEEEYSVPSILEENLNQVFKQEKSIIFFDGLDEIFNASDKIHVKNDIENFHNLFPKIRSITTSRFIGYNEVKLNEQKFCELNINSFSHNQIEEYVNKWYSLEEEDLETRNLEINDFISKMNNIDNELLSNPLLLSLIVILYRNNLKIPESKLEIYQSCTNTLVDKWDASKNLDIKIDQSILQKKEPILSDLAFWQYEALSSKTADITYHQAREKVASSLIKKRVADEFNSIQLAEAFLDYAQKRSIYFDNNFTHKTFLEYYSAYWIYSNIEKKHNIKERDKIFKKYISNPFWFIVLELLLNMIDKDQPDTEIIDTIFEDQLKNTRALSFLVYILPNISNISKEVTLKINKAAILHLISVKKIDQKRKEIFGRIIKNLSLDHQRSNVIDGIFSISEQERNLNYYILINEISFTPRVLRSNVDFEQITNTDHYNSYRIKDPYLFQLDFNIQHSKNDTIDSNTINYFSEFLDHFSEKEFLTGNPSKYETMGFGSFCGIFFFCILSEGVIETVQKNINLIESKLSSTNTILKFIVEADFYFKPSIKILNYLCIKIHETNISDKERLYFTCIILNGLKNRFLPKAEYIQVEDLSTTTKFKALLNKYNRVSTLKNITELTKELNITDGEIVKIVNQSSKWQDLSF